LLRRHQRRLRREIAGDPEPGKHDGRAQYAGPGEKHLAADVHGFLLFGVVLNKQVASYRHAACLRKPTDTGVELNCSDNVISAPESI
jgi:hypothetical protein